MSMVGDQAAMLRGVAKRRTESKLREVAANDAVMEAASSRLQWPAYHSPHEMYGVLCEEVAELFDEVRRKKFDKKAARKELIQVAAVAIRGAAELCDGES